MSKTKYRFNKEDILINEKLTYSEIKGSDPKVHGLLFNARFIQGIYNDKNENNIGRYNRFGRIFDVNQNVTDLINKLPMWYEHGLRAITVGLQGGGPCFSFDQFDKINNNPFSTDGKTLDEDCKQRLKKLIKACDDMGIIVIVSYFYTSQLNYFDDGLAIVEAVKTASKYLSEINFSNVMIEIGNEFDIGDFQKHPIIGSPEGMSHMINLAREYSDNKFAVGTSGSGGYFNELVAKNSDIIIVHGNGLSRESYYRFIKRIQECKLDKPIICNEDSQMISQLDVAYKTHTSWGYYNNMTKQEPPIDWSITRGEDEYFAKRLKKLIMGETKIEHTTNVEDYYLQGFEDYNHISNRRYIKLTTMFSEQIDYVEYFEDEKSLYVAYDQPFLLYTIYTWHQHPYTPDINAKYFYANIHLKDGTVLQKKVDLKKIK